MKELCPQLSGRGGLARRAHVPGVSGQRGVFLVEALIGILIFSIGILAMVAIQTRSVSIQSDSEYRIEAANLVNQMVAQIWANADHSSDVNLSNSLLAFAHQASGTSCAFNGPASANQLVTKWVTLATAGDSTIGRLPLPGSTTAMQQIKVDVTNNDNHVEVSLCWQAPLDPVPHKYSVNTSIK